MIGKNYYALRIADYALLLLTGQARTLALQVLPQVGLLIVLAALAPAGEVWYNSSVDGRVAQLVRAQS